MMLAKKPPQGKSENRDTNIIMCNSMVSEPNTFCLKILDINNFTFSIRARRRKIFLRHFQDDNQILKNHVFLKNIFS